jgi:hypothetical protein
MTLLTRIAVLLTLPAVALAPASADDAPSILAQLPTSSERIVSTIPLNGDVNPYGVAFVPQGFREDGRLELGDILVSE